MPSRFPGMDPFIEGQVWSDFHAEMMTAVRAALTPQAIPRYYLRIEERVYLETQTDDDSDFIVPDAFVLERAESPSSAGGVATATMVAIRPALLPLLMPERRRHVSLTLRDRDDDRVVTIIEILSPKNKRAGSDGRLKYLRKRASVLLSEAHLVEIDLLRGGVRLPMAKPLPEGDYYAIVSRVERRPLAEVYAWSLRHLLPTIPVPLAGEDPDLLLDLQACFTTVYDRAAYAYSLRYRRPVQPTLPEADAAWAQQVLTPADPADPVDPIQPS